MKRYLLHMRYIGTNFSGMQKQPNQITVQGVVEDGLTQVLKPKTLHPVALQLSSRTDAGVHALSTTVHVDLDHPTGETYNVDRILKRANNCFRIGNHDVRLTSFVEVNQEFNARHSATSRTYIYRFLVPKYENEGAFPIAELDRSFVLRSNLFDVERVKRGVKLFLGTRDFRTFSGKVTNRYTNSPLTYVRTLDYMVLEKTQPLMVEDPLSKNFDYWIIKCTAKAFLYNQVRRMVGALLALGTGALTEKDIRCMLEVPSKHSWNSRAICIPSHGLYLCNVAYASLDLYKIKSES